MASLHYSRNNGYLTMCGLPGHDANGRTVNSWTNARMMTDADHEHLAEVLHQVKGMVIVSGYPSELYDRLYAGWRCIPHASRAQNAKPTTECLWLSPNIQTTLF